MRIQVLLNNADANYAVLQPDVQHEISALVDASAHKPDVLTQRRPPPEGTLPAAEVYQFIIDHHGDIASVLQFLGGLCGVVAAVVRRRNSPVTIVLDNGRKIDFPASSGTQKKFLAQASTPSTVDATGAAKARPRAKSRPTKKPAGRTKGARRKAKSGARRRAERKR